MIKIALAGNPNCGKTTLFNALTGSTARVGNWPGVTVDKRVGKYKKGSELINIVDLPGIYSLSPYTPEEVIARNFILDERPDVVVNVIDSTNLERNLYLTTQLLEIDVPVVVALNMMDLLRNVGDTIDINKLSKQLHVPVVEISALRDKSFNDLMELCIQESKKTRIGHTILEDNKSLFHAISDVKIALSTLQVHSPLFHAVKLVENDQVEAKMHPNVIKLVDEYKNSVKDDIFGNDLEAIIADARYKYIEKYYSPCYINNANEEYNSIENDNLNNIKINKTKTKTDKIDKILTNKWLGIPIFLAIIFFIFHLTFSENLFFLGGLFNDVNPSFAGTPFEGLFWTDAGINSPGVVLMNFVSSISDLIINSTASGLQSISSPEWVIGFVCDGVLSGVLAVISFIPQIMIIFLLFSILEDSGYMARVAFILDRIFRKFGLSGRALLPLITGFGCSIPAITGTRTLANQQERETTIRIIPFFSCGAKLPILTAIAGAICTMAGVPYADLIVSSMYLLGIVVAIISALIMRHTINRGKTTPFIMELPTYHAPRFGSLMIHLWDKLKHYVAKAFTVILVSTIIVWGMLHLSWDWQYISGMEIEQSMMAGIGQFLTPIFTPLGFGSQLSGFSWVFVVAAITGLIAKENVIATFATLAAVVVASTSGSVDELGEIDSIIVLIQATGINTPGLISFIAFNLLTIPCFAACATAKAEMNKRKFKGTILFWILTSFIVSSLIYTTGTWWWTSFIWLSVGCLIFLGIVIFNKKRPLIEV